MGLKKVQEFKKFCGFEKKFLHLKTITNLKNAHVLHGFEKMVTNLENNINGFEKSSRILATNLKKQNSQNNCKFEKMFNENI